MQERAFQETQFQLSKGEKHKSAYPKEIQSHMLKESGTEHACYSVFIKNWT